MFHVCDAFSRTKRVEMDVMGIEMTYGVMNNEHLIKENLITQLSLVLF